MENTTNQYNTDVSNSFQFENEETKAIYEKMVNRARRTAFVARFIVLRESKRTKAHRIIEKMSWSDDTTAEELAMMFRQVFIENGDKVIIDIPNRKINLLVSDEVLEERRKKLKPFELKVKTGYLAKYARCVQDASHGAII